MNPFQALYDKCNTGTNREKLDGLAEFPSIIDVELTNTCNFRCRMCPTGNRALKREAGFMKAATFNALVSQCKPHGTALRFIGWGEPTLHPHIINVIWAASQAGLLTHLNTNGSKIDDAFATALINAGLSSIKFSFQGVDAKTFKDMRNTDYFAKLMVRVFTMHRARIVANSPIFLSVSTTTTNETPEMVEAFESKLKNVVDQVSVGKTILEDTDITGLSHWNPCPEVFDKLTVLYDGSAVVCCKDYNNTTTLGNINETPIAKLWTSGPISEYRKRLADEDYSSPLCVGCYDYLGVTG